MLARMIMVISLVATLATTLMAYLMHFKEWSGAYEVLNVGHAFAVLYWIAAIAELVLSKELNKKTRVTWSIMLAPLLLISIIRYAPLLAIFFVLLEWGYLKLSKKMFFTTK